MFEMEKNHPLSDCSGSPKQKIGNQADKMIFL